MADFTTGTVTFLFTDIEGSTLLWEQHPEAANAALVRHDAIIENLVVEHLGIVVRPRGEGDSRFAVFPRATDAVTAAASIQKALYAEPWPTPRPLRVRMALHTGEAELRDGDYYGSAVNRCARLRSAAHGGQTLISQATFNLVSDALAPTLSFLDLGEHRLKDLERPEHIFQLVIPDLPADFPPLNTLDRRPHNLPIQRTPIIGREKEVEAISEILLRDRTGLLTLTGPGGTGKTRLGLQVSAELADQFDAGAFMVALAPIDDPSLVVSTIARTLEIPDTGGRTQLDALKDYLRPKHFLLFLDNFEQVLPAGPVVTELLAAAPRLKVLVTSREALHLYGEYEYPVSPLTVPDLEDTHLPPQQLSQYEAVRLFIERAKAIKPDFSINDDNAPAVAEICFRLDGLPLAIELAAARIRLLPPQAMLPRLQGKLQARLQLLTGGARDLPARQQTLRGAIEWSYDLLTADEQKLFNMLSIFMGGCTLEAAEAVCDVTHLAVDLLNGLESLVSKSLVRQSETSSGEPRFWMLETIREYGLEQLAASGELDNLRRRHADYFVALAEEGEKGIVGPQIVEWLDRLEAEHDNFQSVLEWAVGREDGDWGLRLIGSLWHFWQAHGYMREVIGWVEESINAAGTPTNSLVWVKVLMAHRFIKWNQGDIYATDNTMERAVAIARRIGAREYEAWGLSVLHTLRILSNDHISDRAAILSTLQKVLVLDRQLGNTWYGAFSIMILGLAHNGLGDFDEGRALCEEALILYRKLGDLWGVSQAVNILGDLARIRGDYAEAQRLYEESLALYRKLGNKADVPASLHNLAYVALHQNDLERATLLFKESIDLQLDRGNRLGVIECLFGFAGTALAAQQIERATRLFVAATRLQDEQRAQVWPAERAEHERSLAQLHALMDDAAWQAAWAKGQSLTLDQAVDYALQEN